MSLSGLRKWFYDVRHYALVPPQHFIRRRFKEVFAFEINLKDPATFNEKLQWKKLFDRNPLYTICSDKIKVRRFVKELAGEDILVPLLYEAAKPSEADLLQLQPPFIIKANHGSNRNIMVLQGQDLDIPQVLRECRSWLKENYYWYGKEWQYLHIKPRILVERLLLDKNGGIPHDYKFHCFNGEVEFIQLDTGRHTEHKRTILSPNWEILPFQYCAKSPNGPVYEIDANATKPDNLSSLIHCAQLLSKQFPYVRVDLYSVENKVFFGELTFTPGSGFLCFFPAEYDLYYGEKLPLTSQEK